MESRRPRVVLYSHDTMGLGHMRRNVLLARALSESSLKAITLMIAGAPEAVEVCKGAGIPCLALPPLAKNADGSYTSRTLQVGIQDLIALRGRTIRAALEAFEPDALIVDNVPRGAKRELDEALVDLRKRGGVHCVLGLRDVLDSEHTVRREWEMAHNIDAICEFYDEVWVYGDPAVCNPVREYGFPECVAGRTHHVGYLDQRARFAVTPDTWNDVAQRLELPPGPLAVCVVGGGQDGGALAQAFAAAARPPEMNGVILTGPFMPEDMLARLRDIAATRPRLRVLGFVQEPLWLLARAARIVAMGGYNSVCEILSLGKPALIVPRVVPRREQAIRAERLRTMGLLDVLSADALSPQRISDWLFSDPLPRLSRQAVQLNGLTRVADRLQRLLAPAKIAERRRSSAIQGARYAV